MKSFVAMLGGIVVLSASLSGTAVAAVEDLQINSNPSGLCQGALPVQDTKIRKRPLAVTNEGTSDAFVTCSFTTITAQTGAGTLPSSDVVSYFGAFFANTDTVDQTVTCTAAIGYENDENLLYVTKSTLVKAGNLPGGPNDGYIFFEPTDADQTRFYQMVSMSCKIPPHVSINDTYVGQWLDDNAPAIAN